MKNTALTITDMPEELIHIIVSYLDTMSVKSLYDTNAFLRSVIKGAARKCDLSFTTIPISSFLGTNFFKDISLYLREVNMSGVWDIDIRSLIPSLRTLKYIRTLDVSYTNIGIDDLSAIYRHCPSIIDITIDFKFSTNYDPASMTEYQDLFCNFKNVHFISDFMGKKIKLALKFLAKSQFNKLKFSHIPLGGREYSGVSRLNSTLVSRLSFDHLHIVHHGDFQKYHYLTYPADQISAVLDLNKYEAIGVEYYDSPYLSNNCSIKTSSIFVEYLSKYLKGKTKIYIESWDDHMVCGFCSSYLDTNFFTVMAWNKDTTQFDDSFYLSLEKQLNALVHRVAD